jgi:hypothetical protein
MTVLTDLLHRDKMRELAEAGIQRNLAQAIFTDWRDRYVTALVRCFRFHDELRRAGRSELGRDLPSRDWCNAAILILTIPEEAIQDRFLRADLKKKGEMVAAVIQDGGICDAFGRYVELPL